MTEYTTSDGTIQTDEELRQAAIKRLKDKRDFKAHVLAYMMVNALLVAIWATTSAGFFWPVFPLFGWGIGLAFHAWDVYSKPATAEQVAAEMERLRRG